MIKLNQAAADMDIKKVFRNLVTNKYMSDFDYIDTELSFKTVFHITAYSYRCCACAFEHEYMEYVTESGDIDEEIYNRIETCLVEGKCPHVKSFLPKEYLRDTGIYGIHIAVARGTEEALEEPCVRYGKYFGTDPFSMAILKNNLNVLSVPNILESCDNWYAGRLGYVHRLRDNDCIVRKECIGIFELCVRKKNPEVLKLCTEMFYYEAGYAEALELAFKENLEEIQTILIQEIEKFCESDTFEMCCEVAIVHNRNDILETLLGCIDDEWYFTFRHRLLCKLYKFCIALCREKCSNLIVEAELPVPPQLSQYQRFEILTDLFCRHYDRLKDEYMDFIKTINDPAVNDNQDDNSWTVYQCLHQYPWGNKDDPRVLKTLIDLGADINATDCRGRTPLICILKEGLWHDIEFRRTVELLIFENPDLGLHQSAVLYAIQRDGHIHKVKGHKSGEEDWILVNVDKRIKKRSQKVFWEEYICDAQQHAWNRHDIEDGFALNFMGPLLIECGFPIPEGALEYELEKLHPAEQDYIRANLEVPRTLTLCCRDSLRKHFRGRQVHYFMELSNAPKQIKDFVLLKPLLKCVPSNLLT